MKMTSLNLSYQKDRTLQAIVHACKDEMIKGHKIYTYTTYLA